MPTEDDEVVTAFDPLGLIGVLNEHLVDFVVAGGFAAGVQGAVWVTIDLDIAYSRERGNLTRLATALTALDAQPVGLPVGVAIKLDARALTAADVWTLWTRLGRLDLMSEPAPGLTFQALRDRARTIEGRETYRVASINDLVAMKRHAGRPKDIAHLDILATVADVMGEQS